MNSLKSLVDQAWNYCHQHWYRCRYCSNLIYHYAASWMPCRNPWISTHPTLFCFYDFCRYIVYIVIDWLKSLFLPLGLSLQALSAALGKLKFQVGSSDLPAQNRDVLGEVENLQHTINILSMFCITWYSTSTPLHYSPHFLSLTDAWAHTGVLICHFI